MSGYIRAPSRLVGRLICPIFGEGCAGVADAPFARSFGIADGYIGAVLYIVIIALLLAPSNRWGWIAPVHEVPVAAGTTVPAAAAEKAYADALAKKRSRT
jgi:uncharacterized membrane protein